MIFYFRFFPLVSFDTSGIMIRLSVPEIEGGSPERHGGEEEGEEGLVLDSQVPRPTWTFMSVGEPD